MATPPKFQQVPTPALEGLPLYEMRVPGSVGWAGYVVMNTAAGTPLEIGIADSLNGNYQGAYVFCATRPAALDTDPAGVLKALVDYVKASIKLNRALFWLKSSQPSGGLPVTFGLFPQFGFQFGPDPLSPKQWVVNTNLNASLGSNLVFNVNATLRVSADEGNAQLVCSYTQFTTQRLISLQSGASFLGIDVKPISAQIPLSGPNTATFVFTGTMNPSTTFAPPPQTGLTQGLQYRYNSGGSARQLFYPVFNLQPWPQSLSLVGTIDLSDPVNTVVPQEALQAGVLRSGFAFAGAPSLASNFLTPQGNPISLIPSGLPVGATLPAPGAGGFALASSSVATAGLGTGFIYLAPTGQFGVSGAGTPAGQPVSIMGGLFGSEAFALANYNPSAPNDTLCFVPSQPAFAPVFPFEVANLQNSGSGALKPRLDPTYVTPWATVLSAPAASASTVSASAAQGVVYQSEPEGSSLYGVVGAGAGSGPTVLASTPPSASLNGSTQHVFPLVPYANSQANPAPADTIGMYESQIIAPSRKKIITDSNPALIESRDHARKHLRAATGTQRLSTSPQGFLVTSDTVTGAYLNVLLAQSPAPGQSQSGPFVPFAFNSPTAKLEAALQTNQLFLVAVNPANLGPFANTANVAGWNLSAPVGQGVTPTSYRNVMILKFCSGSLMDRVTNPNRWTAAEDFSLAPGTSAGGSPVAYAGLSQWLQAYIQAGIDQSKDPNSAAFYRNFALIAQDPNWNGVIVLQADLTPTDLPDQIKGLAAGIDFSQFVAHHFGFTVSRVITAGQPPTLQMDGVSSFFGLIDYQNPAYALNVETGVDPETPIPVTTSDDFRFTVLLLRVLFQNGRIADFQSKVQLTVDALFGSDVMQTVGNAQPGVADGVRMPANGVVLDGSYVAQSGGSSPGIYVFQQTHTSVFQLNSNVLQAVAFTRIQFNTLGTDSAGFVSSRFLVWGNFDFVPLTQTVQPDDNQTPLFDVLSFGSAPATPPLQLGRGLAFSNVVIGMTFLESTPNAQAFTVATNNTAYDLNSSTARDDSLFRGFGLQLKSFINATGQQTPADFGFLPVTSGLSLTPLTPPWYGVVYQVTLGGPGALASAAGFNSDLLLAWAPSTLGSDTQWAVFLGLSLPGASPGAKLFSLEGIFKVGVGSISMIRQPITGGTGNIYCLRLDDIALKIFGIAKLPPDANIQFFLFGNPGTTGSLAWYAAYVANKQATPMLASGAAAGSALERRP